MPPIGRSPHLPGAIAFDFADGIARRTLHVVALVGDVTALELNRGWLSNYRAVGCRLIAGQNQISSHFPWNPLMRYRALDGAAI